MPATIVRGGTATTLHTADLFEPCRCGITHHEDVDIVTTADEWFEALPARQHRSIRVVITNWF